MLSCYITKGSVFNYKIGHLLSAANYCCSTTFRRAFGFVLYKAVHFCVQKLPAFK